MAKNWYPVIDILTCMECGTCVNFCPHGVYDKQKAPVPVVVNPDGCIDHCHGCQKKCPAGAIAYVGDTGNQPNAAPACCCNAEPGTAKGHPLLIEYLYLDLSTCDRCIGTDAVLDESLPSSALLWNWRATRWIIKSAKWQRRSLPSNIIFFPHPPFLLTGRIFSGP